MLGGVLTLEDLVALMSTKPRERFGVTSDVGFTVFDLGAEYDIDSAEFLSQGKSTPFEGKHVFGKCIATVYDGRVVYSAL